MKNPDLSEALASYLYSAILVEVSRQLINKINQSNRQKIIIRRVFFRNRGYYEMYESKYRGGKCIR